MLTCAQGVDRQELPPKLVFGGLDLHATPRHHAVSAAGQCVIGVEEHEAHSNDSADSALQDLQTTEGMRAALPMPPHPLNMSIHYSAL